MLATVVATVLGTLMSFALARHAFRGRAATNTLIFLPMATPRDRDGLLAAGAVRRGPASRSASGPFVIAHIMFCLSFVVVTVKARLAGMDPRLQEAAMDALRRRAADVLAGDPAAGAARHRVGRAAVVLAVVRATSIVTNFNSGTVVTFPMFVWGASQRGFPRRSTSSAPRCS
ncbi:hypothetical protein GCM10020218_074410 [Dactylosporangium vinaceum]